MLGRQVKNSSGPYLHPTRGLLYQEGKELQSHTPETSSARGRRIFSFSTFANCCCWLLLLLLLGDCVLVTSDWGLLTSDWRLVPGDW